MREDFSRLENLSQILNKQSDELNDSLKSFEEKLASLRLGVSAWAKPPIEKHTDDRDGVEYRTTLGYSKITGSWCLTIGYENDMDDESSSFVQLSQASRDIRMKAVRYLPNLLKALEEAAINEVKEVEEARVFMRDMTKTKAEQQPTER